MKMETPPSRTTQYRYVLENAMNAGASVYYINMNNSEMHNNKKAQKDKDKERPEIPVDGNWDK